jgi:microcystin-dependent protein
MSESYVGEIRLFGFGRTPSGWQACDGSLLSIAENDILFTLLGTTYGGDGETTFAVPDLRGRVPIHYGQGPGLGFYALGEQGGTETVTLVPAQLPGHTHMAVVTSAPATAATPGPNLLPGAVSGDSFYVSEPAGATAVAMSSQSTSPAGGSQPHENCMPTLTVQYCISLYGLYPSRN